MPAVPTQAVDAMRKQAVTDHANGVQRVMASGFSARCRAADGAFILTQALAYMPNFMEVRPGHFIPLWGGYCVASPNPFRSN